MVLGLSEQWGPHACYFLLLPFCDKKRPEKAVVFRLFLRTPRGSLGAPSWRPGGPALSLPTELLHSHVLHINAPSKFCLKTGFCC